MLAKFEKITDLGKSINSTFPEALTLSITLGFKIGCLSLCTSESEAIKSGQNVDQSKQKVREPNITKNYKYLHKI